MKTHIKFLLDMNKIFKSLKKKFFAFFLAVFSFGFFQAQELSENAKILIDDFFNLRMNLSVYDENDTESIIFAIENFSKENAKKISLCNAQEKIILENFFIMEKYNYLYEKPGQAKIQHELLGNQLEKIEQFLKENNETFLNEYFYCTQADVTSCYMGYSLGDVLKYGASVKPLYEKALEANPNFSYALTNIGQWYYFAPKFAGGSKKKSLAYFEKAQANALTPAQKYFADIFLSQLLFENKHFEKCNELLDEAQSFCPQSNYLKKIRSANKDGLSLYEYNKKKSPLKEKN